MSKKEKTISIDIRNIEPSYDTIIKNLMQRFKIATGAGVVRFVLEKFEKHEVEIAELKKNNQLLNEEIRSKNLQLNNCRQYFFLQEEIKTSFK